VISALFIFGEKLEADERVGERHDATLGSTRGRAQLFWPEGIFVQNIKYSIFNCCIDQEWRGEGPHHFYDSFRAQG
jgi:hypothetical protein